MALPVNALLHPVSTVALDEQPSSRAPLLDYIYRVSPQRGRRDVGCGLSIREVQNYVSYIYLFIYVLLKRAGEGERNQKLKEWKKNRYNCREAMIAKWKLHTCIHDCPLNNCSLIRIPQFSWNMVYVYLILKRTVYIVGISTVFVWQNLFFKRRKKYNGLCNLFALKDINEIYHIKIISLIIFIVLKIFEFHPLLMTRCGICSGCFILSFCIGLAVCPYLFSICVPTE